MIGQNRQAHGSVFARDMDVLAPRRLIDDLLQELHGDAPPLKNIVHLQAVVDQVLGCNDAVNCFIVYSSKDHNVRL